MKAILQMRNKLKKLLTLTRKTPSLMLRNPLVINNLTKWSLRDSVSRLTKMTSETSSKKTSDLSAESTSSRMKTDALRVLPSSPSILKKVSTRLSLALTLSSWADTSLSKEPSLRVTDQASNLKLSVKTPRLSSLEISPSSVILMTWRNSSPAAVQSSMLVSLKQTERAEALDMLNSLIRVVLRMPSS